jgi:hypothetical protein
MVRSAYTHAHAHVGGGCGGQDLPGVALELGSSTAASHSQHQYQSQSEMQHRHGHGRLHPNRQRVRFMERNSTTEGSGGGGGGGGGCVDVGASFDDSTAAANLSWERGVLSKVRASMATHTNIRVYTNSTALMFRPMLAALSMIPIAIPYSIIPETPALPLFCFIF